MSKNALQRSYKSVLSYMYSSSQTHLQSLQEHIGVLNFVIDAWTSPNHKAYMAVTVHLENGGVPVAMLLDIVELACSYSGINLAAAFAKILEDFGIGNKVSNLSYGEGIINSLDTCRSSQLPATMHQTTTLWLQNSPFCWTTSQVLQIKLSVFYTY